MVVIAGFAAVTLLSACGSSTSPTGSTSKSSASARTLNTHHVALAIEQSILSQLHVHASVFCPKTVPQQKGRNFACIATYRKTKTPFAVTQRNDDGYVTYRAE
jgi:hypothetical protein